MTDRHDEFAEWDAAYVLGALSPGERAAYEQHLAECPECSAAVRGLAVIPGLLGKVPADEVPGDVSEPPPADLLARTRSMAQGEVTSIRRRRRWTVSLAAVAASAVLVIGGAVVVQQRDSTPPGVTVAMQQVHTNPLSATLQLHDKAWGTEVSMKCTYAESAQWGGGEAVYSLYVVDDAGHASSISTWSAEPGTTAKLTAATAVPRAKIAHVQIRNADGSVLLSANPD
ncbi:anti-sigma factor family protein [Flexivirga alba]|uniref:Anti-sigma factor family protein n=1 Tax=Flexivirga alba TaxID=702742 RepID=A0ABW2AGB5_9MICO